MSWSLESISFILTRLTCVLCHQNSINCMALSSHGCKDTSPHLRPPVLWNLPEDSELQQFDYFCTQAIKIQCASTITLFLLQSTRETMCWTGRGSRGSGLDIWVSVWRRSSANLAQDREITSCCEASEISGLICYTAEPLLPDKYNYLIIAPSPSMLGSEGRRNCKSFSIFEEPPKLLGHYSKWRFSEQMARLK